MLDAVWMVWVFGGHFRGWVSYNWLSSFKFCSSIFSWLFGVINPFSTTPASTSGLSIFTRIHEGALNRHWLQQRPLIAFQIAVKKLIDTLCQRRTYFFWLFPYLQTWAEQYFSGICRPKNPFKFLKVPFQGPEESRNEVVFKYNNSGFYVVFVKIFIPVFVIDFRSLYESSKLLFVFCHFQYTTFLL